MSVDDADEQKCVSKNPALEEGGFGEIKNSEYECLVPIQFSVVLVDTVWFGLLYDGDDVGFGMKMRKTIMKCKQFHVHENVLKYFDYDFAEVN